MTALVVASSQPRAGRSLVAAAVAYRMARAGRAVSLARLAGDDGADSDAATFASLEGIVSPGIPLSESEAGAMTGDIVFEAPAGSVRDLAHKLHARVLSIGPPDAPADLPGDSLAGIVATRVPVAEVAAMKMRPGVLAVLAEDAVLAAPSIRDMAMALDAKWLSGDAGAGAIERVMIGTVASDAASPYFGQRDRTCVVTRFDKTDIQLAALQTDIACLIITGGGAPSPYLLDRIAGQREEIALLAAKTGTVETMRVIEGLYGVSRFDGTAKLARAVEMLDDAGVPVEI